MSAVKAGIEIGTLRKRIAALERERDALLGLCRCGHSKEEHEGHTFALGSAPSNHCSQCCGRCLTYRPISQDVEKLVNAAREAQCWMVDGTRRTPEQRGAKCDTAYEAIEQIAEALKPFPEQEKR